MSAPRCGDKHEARKMVAEVAATIAKAQPSREELDTCKVTLQDVVRFLQRWKKYVD